MVLFTFIIFILVCVSVAAHSGWILWTLNKPNA